MRPNSNEMLQGVIEMLEGEVLPAAAKSANAFLLDGIGIGALMLKLIAGRWDSEGKILYDRNKELRGELRESIQALRGADLDALAGETETVLARKYVLEGDYPTIEVLTKESCDLKEIVEKIFVAVTGIKKPNASLADIHTRLRSIIGRQAQRDFIMVEQVMSTFAPPK